MNFTHTPEQARAALVAALRSGDYKQGRNQLRTVDDKHCCLGVACDVFHKLEGLGEWNENDPEHFRVNDYQDMSDLPEPVREWLGFEGPSGQLVEPIIAVSSSCEKQLMFNHLASLNDFAIGYDFNKIADVIESNKIALR